VERYSVYYKGEGDGFPQVQAVVSLVSPSCPWLVLAPKVFQLCTNQLCCLVLCRSMWVIKCLSFFLVPSHSSSTPLYPPKVLQAREHVPNSLLFRCFCLRFTFESIKEFRSTSRVANNSSQDFVFGFCCFAFQEWVPDFGNSKRL
jgi:hypothetical protein